jgi:hypothetical protein|tara:strand:+ start:646 stop:1047 length:402 start_codon:yes stop_codon:yes gene_type:complete
MTTQKAKKVLLEKNEKQVCNSYIDQAYLFSKYQTLKADTKELVSEYFLKLKQNIIILSNTRYIQKIERTSRRFDSKSFIDYVTTKSTTDEKISFKELQVLLNGFYKQIKVVELKPFDDKLQKQKLKKGEINNA